MTAIDKFYTINSAFWFIYLPLLLYYIDFRTKYDMYRVTSVLNRLIMTKKYRTIESDKMPLPDPAIAGIFGQTLSRIAEELSFIYFDMPWFTDDYVAAV